MDSSIKMQAPQIIWISIWIINLIIHGVYHGEAKEGNYNLGANLIMLLLSFSLMKWGGFF